MRRILFVLAVLLVAVAPMIATAQEPEGGVIIEGNGGTSIGSLLYIRCSGTDCRRPTAFMYPSLLSSDPETQFFTASAYGAVADSFEVSEDGLTYTFQLRKDLTWTDGTPVTGWDYKFAAEALLSGEIESPYTGSVEGRIESIDVSEDGYTVTVKLTSAACDALGVLSTPRFTPAHVFGWEPGMTDFDFSVMIDHAMDTAPEVTSGVFMFDSMQSGERVTLVSNPDYPTPAQAEGFLYVNVPDQTVMVERFLAGELNIIDGPQVAKRQEIRDNADLQYFEYPGRSWDYVGLNLANPDNPQNGVELDAEGNVVRDENGLPIPIEQEPHPLFSDVRVRRALQHAINIDEIMEKAVLGEGTQMASSELPSSWALNPDLAPVPYDPELAKQLLAEAGWTPGEDGILVNADGVRFSFELLTNEGNTRRGQIGELIQDQLAAIGIEVDFVAIDFNQLLDIMDGQTFDAFILGWQNGYPIDPDQTELFTSAGDIVGSGFNMVSYINPEIDQLMEAARTVPGCAAEDRAAIYYQIQEILQRDQPYLWLFAQNGFYAANNSIEGWAPFANELYWNVEEWTIAQ